MDCESTLQLACAPFKELGANSACTGAYPSLGNIRVLGLPLRDGKGGSDSISLSCIPYVELGAEFTLAESTHLSGRETKLWDLCCGIGDSG